MTTPGRVVTASLHTAALTGEPAQAKESLRAEQARRDAVYSPEAMTERAALFADEPVKRRRPIHADGRALDVLGNPIGDPPQTPLAASVAKDALPTYTEQQRLLDGCEIVIKQQKDARNEIERILGKGGMEESGVEAATRVVAERDTLRAQVQSLADQHNAACREGRDALSTAMNIAKERDTALADLRDARVVTATYGRHHEECRKMWGTVECTCGFDAALAFGPEGDGE